jgi:hypothetical protein
MIIEIFLFSTISITPRERGVTVRNISTPAINVTFAYSSSPLVYVRVHLTMSILDYSCATSRVVTTQITRLRNSVKESDYLY